jgi:hypothetical protein
MAAGLRSVSLALGAMLLGGALSAAAKPSPAVCYGLGEVAIKAHSGARLSNPRVERAAQKTRIRQEAQKLGIESVMDQAERIVDQAYDEPQLSIIAFGQATAADCLRRLGLTVNAERADACFEVARYTREFMLNRRFMSLERQLQGVDKLITDPLERELTRTLAQEVYRSPDSADAQAFAAGFYARCVAPAGSVP